MKVNDDVDRAFSIVFDVLERFSFFDLKSCDKLTEGQGIVGIIGIVNASQF
jgi:hypothetical protein